jgi:hypothetical protein
MFFLRGHWNLYYSPVQRGISIFPSRAPIMRYIFSLSLFAVLLTLLIGCGGRGLELAPVRGRVSINNMPITEGKVTFTPELGPAAVGELDAKGEFELMTGNEMGAVVGNHKITITPAIGGVVLEPGKIPTAGSDMQLRIPQQYQAIGTTPLAKTVTPDQIKNDFLLKLAP